MRAVAIAPDSSWLAAASDGGILRIWNPTTGQPYALMRRATDHVTTRITACCWVGMSSLPPEVQAARDMTLVDSGIAIDPFAQLRG